MVHCCVPGCKNTHHHKNKKDEWHVESRNYSLHDLPGEDRMEVRELWMMAINRSTLPKDVAVCSDHFTEDCFDEKWEEYKRKYGPTKVKRKLKVDAIPTIFPGRVFFHEKVQRIREDWKNKVLQKRLEYERLRLEKEYRDRFKTTQTECQCKCRCKLRKKHFSQQVNFQFKFMEDVSVQFPKDLTEAVKDDHSYTQGGKKKPKVISTQSTSTSTSSSSFSSSAKDFSERDLTTTHPHMVDINNSLQLPPQLNLDPPTVSTTTPNLVNKQQEPERETDQGAILDFTINKRKGDSSELQNESDTKKTRIMNNESYGVHQKSVAVSTD
jgi:THAP domain.